MKPIDFRNESFAQLQERLSELRQQVFNAWADYEERFGAAGATTREVAKAAGIDILTFRPRCTELYQMGALMVVEVQSGQTTGGEGRYRLRSLAEWEQWFNEQRDEAISGQQQLL